MALHELIYEKRWKQKVLKSKLLSVRALLLLNPAKVTDKCSVVVLQYYIKKHVL